MNSIGSWFSRRSPGLRRLIYAVLAMLLLGSALWGIPTPYYITAPGAAIDTSRLVSASEGTPRRRALLMLVVTTRPANLFWYLYALLDRRAALETKSQFLGTIPDYGQYLELNRQMMRDSQATAKAIALQELGYGKGVRTVGARVVDFANESPSSGLLQKGDVIIGLGEAGIGSVSDLRSFLQTTPPGTDLPVRVRRAGRELAVTVRTAEHTSPERKGTSALGIILLDELVHDIPVPVEIRPGAITGPSAGLVFTLQIIDQLTPGGITNGLVIAGTGTVERDGRVGAIGGVVQKVYTAEAAGARVMFVPRPNYDAARAVATRVEVVPVDYVRDALRWLRQHGPAPSPSVPAA